MLGQRSNYPKEELANRQFTLTMIPTCEVALALVYNAQVKRLLAFAIVAVLGAVCLAACQSQVGSVSPHAPRETALQRVLKSGTIRCSYLLYASYFKKDPNTGKLSGIFHDVMEEIGKNANLKIDWVEEVGFQTIFPGLETNRHDVFAGGLWPNTSRAKAALFTVPVNYSAITAWVRPDDHRFDRDISLIDSPSVKIATIDGAMEDLIAKSSFPKAQRVSLPELSPFVQNLLNVTHKKADVTFAEPQVVAEFLKTNKGALRQIGADKPIRIFGNCLAVKTGETDLRDFLDVALREITYDGRVEKILKRYESSSDDFYPIAPPYTVPHEMRTSAP